jgi:YVTN family beta-propeller protein
LTAIFSTSAGFAADFHPPAGESYALVGASGTILPGGRILKPLGVQIETGPGPFGLAVSPRGTVATADIGYEQFGITIVEPPGKRDPWRVGHLWARGPDWKGVTSGIAFDSEKSIWISEGDSGQIRQIDIGTGDRRKVVSLNSVEWTGSVTVDLAYDAARHLLFAVDRSNERIAVVDARSGRVVSSVRVGKMPFAIALSPDGFTAYVTESNAVCAVDVRNALEPAIAGRTQTPSPEAVLATADRVYVSNALDDTITVISASDRTVVDEIPLGIPSLEQYRGVIPAGLAYDPVNKWLLVAESGINALGVVDTAKNELIGHIPVGWMPTRVAVSGDRVYVTNARGRGTGPNPRRVILELGEVGVLHRGSVSTFIVPNASELPGLTKTVFSLNGFGPYSRDAARPPAAIRHVVLIVKENRTFDEVLGDVTEAGNGPVVSFGKMARFGMHGLADGGRRQFSLHDAAITPNQHEIARRWAFSDNFYTDGDTKAEGDIWLNGSYPDPVRESGILASDGNYAASDLLDHLRRAGVTFQDFDEAWRAGISDQERADRYIAEIDRRYAKGGEPFPRFVRIHLPNDRAGNPDAEHGYPYEASYVVDNDFATGRIVEYLSHSPWWRDMAIFITESDTQESQDHVDAHRTLLFAAGPYIKRNYVSHTNASFPGLLRTVFELLRVPSLNLMDKTAASPRDLFTEEPDFTAFTAAQPETRIFDPAQAPSK